MGCSNSKENAMTITYLTPKLISVNRGKNYWAIGYDKTKDRTWYCYCNEFNDVLYAYPILFLELKKDESIFMIIRYNCVTEKIFTFGRLKSGKILATVDGAAFITERDNVAFVKQGSLSLDMFDGFFNNH
jgi:hypothetical protein